MSNMQYDPQTGEVFPGEPGRAIRPQFPRQGVNLSGARQISQTAAGRNVDYWNLRDHPELNGRKIAMIGVISRSGEFGPFVLISCYLLTAEGAPEMPLVLTTGAVNVAGRALAAADEMTADTPVIGTLRLTPGGQAWILD